MTNEINLNNISLKEFGYLVGLYFGDGYSNYSKKDRHYRVDFSLDAKKDLDVKNLLRGLLVNIGLNPFEVKDRGSTRVSVNSKRFKEEVEKTESSLDVALENRDFLLGFLSGFIDSDGYVTKGDIVIVQKDKTVLKKLSKLCERRLGLKTRLWQRKALFRSPFYAWNFRIATRFKHFSHISCKVKRVY